MANDVGLQLLFPEMLEGKILEWCKIQKRYFRLKSCGNSNLRIYPCFVHSIGKKLDVRKKNVENFISVKD